MWPSSGLLHYVLTRIGNYLIYGETLVSARAITTKMQSYD
jgi:hypothetical protein